MKPESESDLPQIGDLIIYPKQRDTPYGHVAVVTDVDSNYVYIGEQNWHNYVWQKEHYVRRLKLVNNGKLTIVDNGGYIIKGWMRVI